MDQPLPTDARLAELFAAFSVRTGRPVGRGAEDLGALLEAAELGEAALALLGGESGYLAERAAELAAAADAAGPLGSLGALELPPRAPARVDLLEAVCARLALLREAAASVRQAAPTGRPVDFLPQLEPRLRLAYAAFRPPAADWARDWQAGPSEPRAGPPEPRAGPPEPRAGPPAPRAGPPAPRAGPPAPRALRAGLPDLLAGAARTGPPARGLPEPRDEPAAGYSSPTDEDEADEDEADAAGSAFGVVVVTLRRDGRENFDLRALSLDAARARALCDRLARESGQGGRAYVKKLRLDAPDVLPFSEDVGLDYAVSAAGSRLFARELC